MRPWLVTGGAGFLGSHVVDVLLSKGVPTIVVDDLSTGKRDLLASHSSDAHFSLETRDVRDAKAMRELFLRVEPEAVVHLAARHFIPACDADPPGTIALNVGGTQSVLSAARAARVERVFFASTGDVYAPSEQPHAEDSLVAPFSIYGLSKLQGEQLVALESRARPEARFVVGRLFNLVGPRETNPHVLPEIVRQLRERPAGPLHLGSTWPRRDLVPVADAARAVVSLVETASAGVTTVNVASGKACSVAEVVRVLGEVLGRKLEVETDPARVRPVERAHLEADVSRLRALVGAAPHADLRRSLRELCEHERLL